MNATGTNKKSRVSPDTPSIRVDLKNRHSTPMTSRIKNDINNSVSNVEIRKLAKKPQKFR